ncbi:MAG: ribonuclease [Pseudomonadota bacterium]|nr:ribonuclease [Pseudomonadota bacterium]
MKAKSAALHTCIYKKHKNGMGGVAIEEDTGLKINILETVEKFALDNDEVLVEEDLEKTGEIYGKIHSIVKHNTHNLTGVIQPYKDKLLLRVANPKFGNYLVIIKSYVKKIDREALFNCIIKTYPNDQQPYFEVELANAIGKVGEDQAYIAQLIEESGLPIEFSKAALDQARQLPESIEHHDIDNRVDLRQLPFVTIDGADAKDFDDAVYCEVEDGLYKLYVAIADVAHYVADGSALDKDAYLRSTSVYFPKQVTPMLPEKISNGLCSLNPHVDRLVMCCQMMVDFEGKIIDYKVYNGVIHSASRLTYTKVQEWIEENSLIPPELISSISSLYLVFQALLHSREVRGAIDFDTIEPMFVFDEQGMVQELQPRVRLEAHKLIEECMLAANVCVADFLIKNHEAALFRIHGKPPIEKFVALKQFLNSIAVPFDVKYEQLTPLDYATLLRQVHDHAQFPAISQAVLRSMQLALYSPNNIGHFGLSYSRYVHFTSPIRRYPDLLVHRVAKSIIAQQKYEYSRDLAEMGNQTSFAERRAEDLERKISSFYKCQYAKTHIGKEYHGIITSVVNFGVFVYIPDLMLDGLVHVTELGRDYFVFDDKKQLLVGRKSGIKFYAGQELKIEIAGVDMTKLFIDFKLVVE